MLSANCKSPIDESYRFRHLFSFAWSIRKPTKLSSRTPYTIFEIVNAPSHAFPTIEFIWAIRAGVITSSSGLSFYCFLTPRALFGISSTRWFQAHCWKYSEMLLFCMNYDQINLMLFLTYIFQRLHFGRCAWCWPVGFIPTFSTPWHSTRAC